MFRDQNNIEYVHQHNRYVTALRAKYIDLLNFKFKEGEKIAARYHSTQVDKSGAPYMVHLRDVALKCLSRSIHTLDRLADVCKYEIAFVEYRATSMYGDYKQDLTNMYFQSARIFYGNDLDKTFAHVTNKCAITIITGWLHDLIEDVGITQTISDQICEIGGKETINAIAAMTHVRGVPYETYLDRVKQNDHAVIVKLCDLESNSDEKRLAKISDKNTVTRLIKKYTNALNYMKEFMDCDIAFVPRHMPWVPTISNPPALNKPDIGALMSDNKILKPARYCKLCADRTFDYGMMSHKCTCHNIYVDSERCVCDDFKNRYGYQVLQDGRNADKTMFSSYVHKDPTNKEWDISVFANQRDAEIYAYHWAYPYGRKYCEENAPAMELDKEYNYSTCEVPVMMRIIRVPIVD